MGGFRVERLQKELHRQISCIFQGDITDNRLSGLEITNVKITPDLRLLTVYFAGLNKGMTIETTLELLQKSSGFIKKQIAGVGIMRIIPEIVFKYDKTGERVEKLDEIFRKIADEKRNNNYYDDDSDNDYYDGEDDQLMDEDLEDYDDYNDDLDEDLEFEYDDIEDEDEDED